jgi:hypothetical protein
MGRRPRHPRRTRRILASAATAASTQSSSSTPTEAPDRSTSTRWTLRGHRAQLATSRVTITRAGKSPGRDDSPIPVRAPQRSWLPSGGRSCAALRDPELRTPHRVRGGGASPTAEPLRSSEAQEQLRRAHLLATDQGVRASPRAHRLQHRQCGVGRNVRDDSRLRLPVDPRHQSLGGAPVALAHRLQIDLNDLASRLLGGERHPVEGRALARARCHAPRVLLGGLTPASPRPGSITSRLRRVLLSV